MLRSRARRVLVLQLSLAGICAGAGSARAVAPPINRATQTAGPDGTPLTAEDMKELDAIQKAVGEFEAASKEYRGTVTHIIRIEYEKKRRELLAKYDAEIKEVEKDEKQRRIDAIALFEQFLAKYPSDKRWTPDVIFRLAELYFERSNDEYIAAVDAAQKAADAASKDPNAPQGSGTAPTADYSKTIDLYKRLIAEFPDYRLIDGAYYLLGYCQGEMAKDPEARQAYLALVCGNKYRALDPPPPPVPTRGRIQRTDVEDPYKDCIPIRAESRFLPEAWTRIGEYHFDANELELAIAAYQHVLTDKTSPYYDKALYKLAWAYYRADKYDEAIRKFDELVVFSDQKKAESGKEGSDLRQEAVQYLGISFAEKDWNGDGIDDPETGLQRLAGFYKGRDAESHVRDIYQKLGDIYFDETEYVQAIEVYKELLARWPLAAENPKVQDRIVLCFERMRNFDQALKEREAFANYMKGTDWYKHNRDNKEAVDGAAEMAEQSIAKFAVDHHKAAQNFKKLALATTPPDGHKLELAQKEYVEAAKGYEKYLEQFPNSKNVYDYTFFYAETLYYAQRFADAAVQYEKVRDSNLDNRYLEDSAFNAIKSYENLVDGDVRSGKFAIPGLPEPGKVTLPVTPIAVPDDVKHLQSDYVAFAERIPASGKLATMAYKVAETDFRYLDFEKARPRMEAILAKYCGDDVAIQAGNAVLTSYAIESNLDKIVEWTDKLKGSKCGSDKARITAAGSWEDLGHDARFQLAQKLLDNKEYEKAAAAFIKIVDEKPEDVNADKALNNAAVAYENAGRFKAATKIYERIVANYPKSTFVDEALFRTAVSYQHAFEFDKAVVSYQRLAVDPRFKGSTHRSDALYNAAVILENDQAYNDAAKLFQQYSREEGVKKEDQAEAFFRSAMIYQKNKDTQKALKTFREYLKEFPGDPKKNLEANFHIAEAIDASKDHRGAMEMYKKIVAEGASVPAASDAAEFPAHAAFILAEANLDTLMNIKFSGDLKKLGKEKEKLESEIKTLSADYSKVIEFKRANWTLGTFFRIGFMFEHYSKELGALASAPCPKEVQAIEKKQRRAGITDDSEMACNLYGGQVSEAIEKLVGPVDEQVVQKYRVVLDQAAKMGVSNDWTKLARQHANAYKPDEFPMNKDEKIQIDLEDPKP